MRRQGGFTLVELLLAVTLLGLLLALAYGGLRATSRASVSGQEVLEESSRLRITHQFVRKQLNLMMPLAFESLEGEDGARERSTFEGSADRIMFVGPMPGYLARGGPQVQVFQLTEGVNGLELLFSHAPLQDFRREFLDEAEPVVLLQGVMAAGFEFLELDEQEQPAGWVMDWAEPDQLPTAVRLNLAFAEGAPVQWPELVATARLDPSSIVPAAGDDNVYAQKIKEMIRRQSSQGNDE